MLRKLNRVRGKVWNWEESRVWLCEFSCIPVGVKLIRHQGSVHAHQQRCITVKKTRYLSIETDDHSSLAIIDYENHALMHSGVQKKTLSLLGE